MISVKTLDTAINYLLLLYAMVAGISRGGVYTTILLLSAVAIIRYIKEPFPLNIDKDITLGMKVIVSALVLSTIFSSHFLMSLKSLVIIIFKIIPFFIAAIFIKNNKTIDKIVLFMAVSLLCGSLVCIWQGLHGMERAKSFLGIMDFAGVIGLIFPVLIVYSFEYKSESMWKNYLFKLTSVVAIIALLFNGTRSIWISTILCSIIYVFISGGYRNKRLLVSIAVGVTLIFAIGFMNHNFTQRAESIANTTTDVANIKRINMWHYAIDVFKEHPFIGTGLGALPAFTGNFMIREESKPIWDVAKGDHIHNTFLQILAENGIVGLSAFLFFLYSAIKSMWRKMYHNNIRIWAQIALLCTIDFIIHGMFDYVITINVVMYTYWFLLGMSYAYFKGNPNISN